MLRSRLPRRNYEIVQPDSRFFFCVCRKNPGFAPFIGLIGRRKEVAGIEIGSMAIAGRSATKGDAPDAESLQYPYRASAGSAQVNTINTGCPLSTTAVPIASPELAGSSSGGCRPRTGYEAGQPPSIPVHRRRSRSRTSARADGFTTLGKITHRQARHLAQFGSIARYLKSRTAMLPSFAL